MLRENSPEIIRFSTLVGELTFSGGDCFVSRFVAISLIALRRPRRDK